MFNIKQGEKNIVKCCESKQLEVFTWLAQRERKEDKGTGTIRKHKREKLELFIEQISILYVQDCGGIAERKCLKVNDINLKSFFDKQAQAESYTRFKIK